MAKLATFRLTADKMCCCEGKAAAIPVQAMKMCRGVQLESSRLICGVGGQSRSVRFEEEKNLLASLDSNPGSYSPQFITFSPTTSKYVAIQYNYKQLHYTRLYAICIGLSRDVNQGTLSRRCTWEPSVQLLGPQHRTLPVSHVSSVPL